MQGLNNNELLLQLLHGNQRHTSAAKQLKLEERQGMDWYGGVMFTEVLHQLCMPARKRVKTVCARVKG